MKMRYLFLLLFGLLVYSNLGAQAPQLINYQGLALDNSGNPLPNQAISLQLSILDGSATGAALYTETHSTTTDNLGIFNVQIGGGTASLSSLDAIDWGAASRFLQVEMDANGGSNYQLIGSSQLVSTPYALYAERVNPDNLPSSNDFEFAFYLLRDTIQLTAVNGNPTQSIQMKAFWLGGTDWEDIKVSYAGLPSHIHSPSNNLSIRLDDLYNINVKRFSFYADCNSIPGEYPITVTQRV